MEKFTYPALDLEKPAFRLVRLFKGAEDKLRCELFQASLEDKENSISYAALSYTWGSVEVAESVEVNEKRLDVTLNLWSALRDLRLPDQDRVLWVDGLCIDQTNDKERGHQVRQMINIYRQAETVLVWLGRATWATDAVIDTLRQLQENHKIASPTQRQTAESEWTTPWTNAKHIFKARYVDLEPRLREGLHDLLSRHWFRRAWILQEIASAQSALVYAGRKHVAAHFFALAPELIGVRPDSHCEAVLAMMPAPGRHKQWMSQDRQLYTLLSKFRQSKSHFARDTIYALLGISSDACDNTALQADYDLSEEKLVENTFQFLYHCDIKCTKPRPSRIEQLLDNLTELNRSALDTHIANSHVHEMEMILARSGFSVKPSILDSAIKHGTPEVIQTLLTRTLPQKSPTAYSVRAAFKNPKHAATMIRILIKEWPDTLRLSTKLLEAATKPSDGITLTQLLLERWNNKEKVTEMMLSAASISNRTAVSVMRELLRVDTSTVTEDVLLATVENYQQGRTLLRLFLHERGSEVRVTDTLLLAAAANHLQAKALNNLLLDQHKSVGRKVSEIQSALRKRKRARALIGSVFPANTTSSMRGSEEVWISQNKPKVTQIWKKTGALFRLLLENQSSKEKITESEILSLIRSPRGKLEIDNQDLELAEHRLIARRAGQSHGPTVPVQPPLSAPNPVERPSSLHSILEAMNRCSSDISQASRSEA